MNTFQTLSVFNIYLTIRKISLSLRQTSLYKKFAIIAELFID